MANLTGEVERDCFWTEVPLAARHQDEPAHDRGAGSRLPAIDWRTLFASCQPTSNSESDACQFPGNWASHDDVNANQTNNQGKHPHTSTDDDDGWGPKSPEVSMPALDLSAWTNRKPLKRPNLQVALHTQEHGSVDSSRLKRSFSSPLSTISIPPYKPAREGFEAPDVSSTESSSKIPEPITAEITFLEGSPSLRNFPRHLIDQLQQTYDRLGTLPVECIKKKWEDAESIYKTSTGKYMITFVHPKSKKELASARYQYGSAHQIVVVAEHNTIESAGILGHSRVHVRKSSRKGTTFDPRHRRIWDPANPYGPYRHIGCIIRRFPDDTAIADKERQTPDVRGQLTKYALRGESQLKRSRKPDDSTPEAKRRAPDRRGLNPETNGSAVTSPVYRRQVIKSPTSSLTLTPKSGASVENELGDHVMVSPLSPLTPSSLATSSAAVASNADEPDFIFKPNTDPATDAAPLRTRPLSQCNTVEKLLVNALVAEIAKKDTLLFSLQVSSHESRYVSSPIKVMRGDADDFAVVLDCIDQVQKLQKGKKAKAKDVQVVVTAEDIEM